MALSFWGHMCTISLSLSLSLCCLVEAGVLTFFFFFNVICLVEAGVFTSVVVVIVVVAIVVVVVFFFFKMRQRIYLFISTLGLHTLKEKK